MRRTDPVAMKLACTILPVAVTLGLVTGCADESQPAKMSEAERLIARGLEAHGSAKLEFSKLDMQWSIEEAMIFESARPGPPWDEADVWQGHAIDFVRERYVAEEIRTGGGYHSHRSTIAGDGLSHQVNHLRRTTLQSEQPFSGSIRSALLLSPALLLRWLSEHRHNVRMDEEHCEGEVCSPTLAVEGEQGFSVVFDPATYRVSGILHGFTDYDGSFTPQSLKFQDYRLQSGVLQPHAFTEDFWGFTGRRGRLEAFQTGVDIDALAKLPGDLVELEAEPADLRSFRVEELAPGIHLAGDGVFYQLFVEFDDFIVALDATSGDVARRIDAIQHAIPGKPFRYALVSHHHNDHLHGLEAYHAQGVAFIASPAHAEMVRARIPDADLLLVDDSFALNENGPHLEFVDIGPVPHSEHMLVGWLPTHGILFEADLFVLGGWHDPPRFASDNALALWGFIRERQWPVQLIVDPHSPRVAALDDLRKAVERRDERTVRATPSAVWGGP